MYFPCFSIVSADVRVLLFMFATESDGAVDCSKREGWDGNVTYNLLPPDFNKTPLREGPSSKIFFPRAEILEL